MLSSSVFSIAQAQPCGNDDASQASWLSRYKENLEQPPAVARSGYRKVPVVFHLVARSNGKSRPAVWRALDVLCEWNAHFDAAGFHFYLPEEGLHLIDDDGIFFDHQLAINQLAMRSHSVDSALNVFVVNTAGATGVVGYFDSQDDWLIVQRSAFVAGNRTTVHEGGHFFSLLHPHFGWDAAAWDASIHGNPAPLLASDGITETERMDSSNCTAAGDMLCDTPPDYNFGLDWQQSCTYGGGAMDPSGTLVDPDEQLIMSYFADSCRSQFSPQQIALMQADWDHPARAYLHRAEPPQSDSLLSPPVLLSPTGPTPSFDTGDSLAFTWEAAPGAIRYYVEVDRSATFDLDPVGFLTRDTTYRFPGDWLWGTPYFWRVFAWQPATTCLPPTPVNTFELTPESGISSSFSVSLQIQQQPAQGHYRIDFQLDRPQAIEIEVLSLDGKLQHHESFFAPSGLVSRVVEMSFLPAGIYLLRLRGLSKGYRLLRLAE